MAQAGVLRSAKNPSQGKKPPRVSKRPYGNIAKNRAKPAASIADQPSEPDRNNAVI